MVEHPRFELGLALYRSLAYRATAFTIKLVLVKSSGFFSYWHLPGLNPSEPPFDFTARNIVKE